MTWICDECGHINNDHYGECFECGEDRSAPSNQETPMHQDLPQERCSQCGSINSELFIQRHKRGIRCLDCGHEHLHEDRTKPMSQQTIWTQGGHRSF